MVSGAVVTMISAVVSWVAKVCVSVNVSVIGAEVVFFWQPVAKRPQKTAVRVSAEYVLSRLYNLFHFMGGFLSLVGADVRSA